MVKKETLLLLAGLVWGAAGFNILRIGLLAYPGHVTLWNLALSALVFGLFQGMVFGRLVQHGRSPTISSLIRSISAPV